MNLNRAIQIATAAHQLQQDKFGQPYLGHLFRVMNAGKTEDEKIVGILHDLVEDTTWTFEDLAKEGFAPHIIDAIKCLTKTTEAEDYEAFIERVKPNALAVKVKISDLTDNLDIKRIPEITEKDIPRLNKYLKAYRMLTAL